MEDPTDEELAEENNLSKLLDMLKLVDLRLSGLIALPFVLPYEQLRAVTLSNYPLLDDFPYLPVVGRCTNLQHLSLTSPHLTEEMDLQPHQNERCIMRNLQSLEFLCADGLGPTTMHSILSCFEFPNFTTIRITGPEDAVPDIEPEYARITSLPRSLQRHPRCLYLLQHR